MRSLVYHITAKQLKPALLTAMLFSWCNEVRAQVMKDTLQEVNVRHRKAQRLSEDERINAFSNGQKIVTIDSATLALYRMQSVANLLSQRLPVFVKSYGINGLATLNIRGSSAAQSQVVWNGVPVNNASLGLSDISLLPVAMISRLHLVYGSSAALWGSGNVGGALILESGTPVFQKMSAYEAALGAGSFGQYQAGGKLIIGSAHLSSVTSVFTQVGTNDFAYKDNMGQKRKTENANLKGIAVQQSLSYKFNDRHSARIAAWLQQYDREIPAALFEAYSGKKRMDQSLRIMGEWNSKTAATLTYVRAAVLADKLQYDDDTIGLHSENTSYQYFLEGGWKKKFTARHQLLVFAPVQLSQMRPDTADNRQLKYALALAYSYSDLRDRFHASANFRGERINEQSVLLPGVGATYVLAPALHLRANVQKTFRAPTLNELYYQPGGNKDLKPEQGWSADAGYKLQTLVHRNVSLTHDVSVFGRIIDDWIIWLGGAVWTPHNIASVYSRGVETENTILVAAGNWKFHLGLNAAYVAATTTSSYLPNDGSIDKQIPYTPKLNGQLNLGFTYRHFYFNYNYTYTGSRYVNVDETGELDGYTTSNVQLNYTMPLKHYRLSLFAQVNNLFDEQYQVVNGRPVPGINWQAGLAFHYQTN